jgi:hypothetical protein
MNKIKMLPAVLTLAAASVACSPSANKSANGTATNNAATANAAAAQPGNAATPAANGSAALPPELQAKAGRNGQQLHLAEGGFTWGSPGLHHANTIEFGQAQADVTRALSDILGPPSRTGRNAECPTGAVDVATFGTLDVHFQDGKFVGWVLDGQMNPVLETYHGLKIGQARGEISAGDGEETSFEQSSLGSEFSAGGVGGMLDGSGPNAKVSTLFSGVTCFAR